MPEDNVEISNSIEEELEFIKSELLPEMVHNRCFCDVGSREFVEFESADIEHATLKTLYGREHINFRMYHAKTIIRFSGEQRQFFLVIKLLPVSIDSGAAYDAFQNEEMLYNKMIREYGQEFFLKCYAADMGKYGRPIIVLQDPIELGYRCLDRELDEEELTMAVEFIGRFHGRGFYLKQSRFKAFREFYAKFQETTFHTDSESTLRNRIESIINRLKLTDNEEAKKKVEIILGSDVWDGLQNLTNEINDFSTICHGNFVRNNLLFVYDKEGRVKDVKVNDWQTMRYGSIGLDLASILIENLGSVKKSSESSTSVDQLQKRIFAPYLAAVRQYFPDVLDEEIVHRELKSKLLYSLLVLSPEDNKANPQTPDNEVFSLLEGFRVFK